MKMVTRSSQVASDHRPRYSEGVVGHFCVLGKQGHMEEGSANEERYLAGQRHILGWQWESQHCLLMLDTVPCLAACASCSVLAAFADLRQMAAWT